MKLLALVVLLFSSSLVFCQQRACMVNYPVATQDTLKNLQGGSRQRMSEFIDVRGICEVSLAPFNPASAM
jgi:hypothetical protein